MNRNKAKGKRREWAVRDKLIAQGYDVVTAGGSLGVFDLVAVPKQEDPSAVRLIQVKSNYISIQEVQRIADRETVARKEIWIKRDYSKDWEVYVIDG